MDSCSLNEKTVPRRPSIGILEPLGAQQLVTSIFGICMRSSIRIHGPFNPY